MTPTHEATAGPTPTCRLGMIVVLLAFLGAGCGRGFSPSSSDIEVALADQRGWNSDRLPPGDRESFDKHFVQERIVELSSEVVVGQVASLDVGGDGAFLVVDRPGKAAYVFGPEGDLKSTLDPRPCIPGANWSPAQGLFRADGSILIANSGRGLFYFGPDGICIEKSIPAFSRPRFMSTDAEHRIWGQRALTTGYEVEVSSPDGEVVASMLAATRFKNIISRMGAGGLVVDEGGIVYMAFPFSPVVYRSDPAVESIQSLGYRPAYFRPLEQDLADSKNVTGATAMTELQTLMAASSMTVMLERLDEDALLVVYANQHFGPGEPTKAFGMHVMNTAGRSLISEEITVPIDRVFGAVGGGRGYRIDPPRADVGGEVSNPRVVVYRFLPSGF